MTPPDPNQPDPSRDREGASLTPTDALVSEQDRRQLLEARMIPNEGPLTDEQRQEVIAAFEAYRKKHGISLEDAARQIGRLKASSLSTLLAGRYPNPDDHLREINNWMEADARRRATKPEDQWVKIGIAKTICDAADLARRNNAMILVVGPSGFGKTITAHEIVEHATGAIYLRLGKHCNSYAGIRDALAAALKIADVWKRMPREMKKMRTAERIFHKLRESHRLLIIDEAHVVTSSGLDFIRDLFDECALPILMLATVDLYHRLEAEASDEDHGQFLSRVLMCVDLADVGKDGEGARPIKRSEIKTIFERGKVRMDPGAVEYLYTVANQLGRGSLRRCRQMMTLATLRARNLAGCGPEGAVTITAKLLYETEAAFLRTSEGREQIAQRRALVAAAG